MESLQEKINKLHPWFKPLNEVPRSIHDVIEHDGVTYVLWSDKSGYSVSYRAWDEHSSGISGVYPSLLKAFKYIPNYNG